ncbi:MAG: histidine phosphatase family protein [Edaphobacter sp.]
MSQFSPPTRITFICHPATSQQKAGIFPSDESLDPKSLEVLSAIPWRAPKRTVNLAAPERRTRQTAEALKLNATDAPELGECNFGLWSGTSLEELQTKNPAGLSEWLTDIAAAPHQGESFCNLMTRIGRWLETQHGVGHIIAVTHVSVVRAAIVHVLHAPPHEAFRRIEIAPLTMTEIRRSRDHWQLLSVGVPLA